MCQIYVYQLYRECYPFIPVYINTLKISNIKSFTIIPVEEEQIICSMLSSSV
jgi:hypothetical protein